MKKQFLFAVLVCVTTSLFSQTNPNEYEEEKPVLLRKEWSIGIHAHTSGWGIEYKRGKNITGYKKWMKELQFVSMKHHKEKKTNPYEQNAKSYFYGKINMFYILRASTGMRHTLYSKADRTGVEVRFNYMVGASLGITKPVYLEIFTEDRTLETVRYEYDPAKSNDESIYGGSYFINGLDQIRLHPGGFIKAGLNFEYAPVHENIKAIEIGAALDAFPTRIPIMANATNKQFFLSFYLTLIYGRKW